jgi:fatty acid desaturase
MAVLPNSNIMITLREADVEKIHQPEEISYAKDYADLKRLIKERGLMDRQPRYYALALAEPVIMLVIALSILILAPNFWLKLISLPLYSLSFVRIGFIMHDAGHRQIADRPRKNDLIGLLYGNLLLGSSISAWREKHNEHHAHTNEIGLDPDLEIPVWAWIEEQAAANKGWVRWMMKYQAYTFFPVLTLSGFFQAVAAIREIIVHPKVEDRVLQGMALFVHHVLYFALLFIVLPWWQALIFWVLHYLMTGFHLGMTFAPNHKGMPVVDANHQMDFLYVQCLTTRNVIPSPVTDYMYGGLNYQVEHHLFPGMPRNNLGKARLIVKQFCEEHDLPYYETGVIESYRQILEHFNNIGAPLREKKQFVAEEAVES